MLTNGQFLSSFVFTLCVIGVLGALAGIAFAAVRVWRSSRPLRERLRHSWPSALIRAAGMLLGVAMTHIKSSAASLLRVLIVRPWRTFTALLVALGSLLRQVPWGVYVGVPIGVLAICSLPFLVFITSGMPLRSVIGIVAAGTLIGVLCAPFSILRYGTSFGRAVGTFFLTIFGGAWGSSMLIAILVAMVSN